MLTTLTTDRHWLGVFISGFLEHILCTLSLYTLRSLTYCRSFRVFAFPALFAWGDEIYVPIFCHCLTLCGTPLLVHSQHSSCLGSCCQYTSGIPSTLHVWGGTSCRETRSTGTVTVSVLLHRSLFPFHLTLLKLNRFRWSESSYLGCQGLNTMYLITFMGAATE
jgi:hypothetical protein